jgi:hypothetical protein
MIWRAPTLILLGLAAGAMGYWTADREDPVTIESIRAVTPLVAPGGKVEIRMRVDRHRSCHLHVEHLLVDVNGQRQLLPDLDFDSLPGPLGLDTFSDLYEVPATFAPGMACYRRISRYECNPIQRYFAPIVVGHGIGNGQACFEVTAQEGQDP